MQKGILKVSLIALLAGVALTIALWSLGFTVSFSPAGTAQSLSRMYLPLLMRDYDQTATPTPTPGNISIDIVEPTQGESVGNDLQLVVTVNSLYELERVSAQVEDRTIDLEFSEDYCEQPGDCYPAWTGMLSLVGLERGDKLLTVAATDVFSESAQAQRSFIYDQKPTVAVGAPVSETVARPQIYLYATCADDGPAGCESLTVMVNGTVIATGQTWIDETVSLADYDGQLVTLQFQGQDFAGQYSSYEERTVYVESSTKLVEVETVGGSIWARIWDVQPDRILFNSMDNQGIYILKIRDRASGEETVMMAEAGKVPASGYLTPLGAIFYEQSGRLIYEWRNGGLIEVGQGNSLTVAGNYAIWDDGGTLILRDLIAGTNTSVPRPYAYARPWHGDVAANGDVVCHYDVIRMKGTHYEVFRYRQGANTQLTEDSYLRSINPRTDGINVVYIKYHWWYGEEDFQIAMYGTSGEVILTPPRDQTPSTDSDYQANNGWVAFTQLGTTDQLQVWTRSPPGQEKQVTYFATSSSIDTLGPNGEVAFINTNPVTGERRWLIVPDYDSVPTEISSALGWSFWQEGQLFVVIGRSLFQVVP